MTKEFAKDGYIYEEGRRKGKYFINVTTPEGSSVNVTIWPPALEDLAGLEKRYQKVKEIRDRFHTDQMLPMFNKLVEVGIAHAKPTHKFEPYYNKTWWLYKASPYKNGHIIGFEWVEMPRPIINNAVGQKYYEFDRQMMRHNGYVYKFQIALERAIYNFLTTNHPTKDREEIIYLVINDRNYWYISKQNKAVYVWKKLAWPEDSVQKLIIKSEN